jgi:CHAT domain-containing protein
VPIASSNGLMVLLNSTNTRYLASSAASLSAAYRGTVVADPTVEQALAAADHSDVRDLVFACHGVYLPDDPAASHLEIGGNLSLARLFESTALPNCRSVTMAASLSGLARAEIASESVGLSGVFLSAGARTVLAAQWNVHELPTTLLLDRHFSYVEQGLSPAGALNAAQRELASMPLEQAQSLVERILPNDAEQLTHTLALLGDPPFAAPEYWATFTATGEF